MVYEVEFMPEATNEIESLDKILAERILKKIKWFSDNFEKFVPEQLTGKFRVYGNFKKTLDFFFRENDIIFENFKLGGKK